MGDRFYQAQLQDRGTCPGYTGKRKQKMAWDDTRKAEAVKLYIAGNPTAENSMEIVKEIADSMGESPNGVRMILTKADVYVKKAAASGTASKPAKEGGAGAGARVSKEAAHARLIVALTDRGATVNDEIVSKLTGKAALYFAEVLEA